MGSERVDDLQQPPRSSVPTAVRASTRNSIRVKSQVGEVKMGNQEQTRGMEQITRAVLQMETVTQATAAGAQESASAGTQLNTRADLLRSSFTKCEQ
jgi:methyl-accepting chemotaxis protein